MDILKSLSLIGAFISVVSAQSTLDSINQPRAEPLEIFERSFKPSFYDTEVYLYKKNDSTRTYGRSIDQLTAAPPETLQGFRIQLLATNNFDDANMTRNALTVSFPNLWMYLVFEAPTYKIRVGDFVNRAEAKPLLDQFQSQGYKKAWIVPDRIIRNQPPKPPVPVTFDSTRVGR
ncbi:MAG: SPOR domain-containing protein [Bacteriovoracaceae bacterium]|nr:SPOR domain-containing protein [Bacteroidota bacterium]